MMHKVWLFIAALLCAAQSFAVTLDNPTFQLQAGQIRFKPGQVFATNSAVLLVKDNSALAEVTPAVRFSLSSLSPHQPQPREFVVGEWRLVGQFAEVSVRGQFTLFVAEQLEMSMEP